MLDKIMGKAVDKDHDTAASSSFATKVAGTVQQLHRATDAPPPAAAPQPAAAPPQRAAPQPSEKVSSIGSGTTITGKIVSDAAVTISGRLEGELTASTATVCEGAHIDGTVVAEELIISGKVKGTIRAKRVKLLGSAVVEGDIFHRSLSIEENALFEGSSRRQENPTDTAAAQQAKGPSS
jgi:cytoskeletal protein CcmA (bactofilin family)